MYRWHNHLNPTINKEAWTQEEELALIRAHQIYGNKWAELAKLLPGRYIEFFLFFERGLDFFGRGWCAARIHCFFFQKNGPYTQTSLIGPYRIKLGCCFLHSIKFLLHPIKKASGKLFP